MTPKNLGHPGSMKQFAKVSVRSRFAFAVAAISVMDKQLAFAATDSDESGTEVLGCVGCWADWSCGSDLPECNWNNICSDNNHQVPQGCFCDSDGDCQSGLYCKSGTCQPKNDPNKCPVFEDNPSNNQAMQSEMLRAFMPCGSYQAAGCSYEVIPANRVFPGEGPGELNFEPYIVQFDIGLQASIRDQVLNFYDQAPEREDRIGGDGEECLEIIIKGGSDATGGCAGKCGGGCLGAGYAKDCMKHDVCATYKALVLGDFDGYSDGFCYDPDCGDEAAQTVMNCWIEHTSRPDEQIICDEDVFEANSDAYGHWNEVTSVFGGPCFIFDQWSSGQGIPDRSRIQNNYDFLAFLESQGVDISLDLS